jgi:hypothetical protein
MDQQTNDLLYKVPSHVDYTQFPYELDDEDIPRERIPILKQLMQGSDVYVAREVARLLCSWGDDEGFEYLRHLVCDQPPITSHGVAHHLRGYDDTYKHVLDSIKMYWARRADSGEVEKARKKIFSPIAKIIYLSTLMQFEIAGLFPLIEREGFTEYIPTLKAHLEAIIKNPKFHHWKVGDCVHLLMKFDPEFVTKTLVAHGYTLADFPNK